MLYCHNAVYSQPQPTTVAQPSYAPMPQGSYPPGQQVPPPVLYPPQPPYPSQSANFHAPPPDYSAGEFSPGSVCMSD